MERLTTRYADHAALKLKKDIGNWCISTDGQKGDYSIYGDAVERLATYEDAEQDGRLAVLPVGVDRLTLLKELRELEQTVYGDSPISYSTGYRNGHRNGRIETLRRVLGAPDETTNDAALKGGAE